MGCLLKFIFILAFILSIIYSFIRLVIIPNYNSVVLHERNYGKIEIRRDEYGIPHIIG